MYKSDGCHGRIFAKVRFRELPCYDILDPRRYHFAHKIERRRIGPAAQMNETLTILKGEHRSSCKNSLVNCDRADNIDTIQQMIL